ncbi:helix-turn-helix transcriptional regulator [Marinobacter salarius]|jgi:prophage regulatory protein|uniref:helix-turn-helix transcriptional regulator n=1 Tax=Marinobacter salarius TaxID=1420917 RepID=UPI0010AA36B0|nr:MULTISPECIES: AlpA family phage regulatory protein [Marinobacter]MBJ7300548.1 AlpA family phage regulatory protein [Marinobacter salarius]HIO30260.1 AlpA family phage regulatory protein [Marinobacter salarius]HIO98726.1 AlpA family phage regulatory protein [Marinobacter salarius]
MAAKALTTETDRQPLDRMLRRKEVEHITARSRSAIYDGIAAGTFPKPVKIGRHAVAWPESVIRNWIAERTEGSKV